MKLFINCLFFVFCTLGLEYIVKDSLVTFVLYLVFLLINYAVIRHYCIVKEIRNNLIYAYTYIGWMIYNSLGFIHLSLVTNQQDNIDDIYLIFIVSTIILFFCTDFFYRRRGSYSNNSSLSIYNLSEKTALIIIIGKLLYYVYLIKSAGGFYAYMFARYGEKVDSSLATLFHLSGGIISAGFGLILPFVCLKCSKWIHYLAILCLLVSMAMGAIGGGSLSLLAPMISIFVFLYFSYNEQYKLKRIKTIFAVLIGLGVLGGLAIRVNRFDNENFQIGNISEAIKEVMISPTFDNAANLYFLIQKVNPIYEFNQFIYPYVHMLPRAIFPWKPMELGRMVGMQLYGTSEESMAGFVTSPMGDFYYDFGYLGMFLGMVFVGCTIGFIAEKINALKKTPFTLALTISIGSSFSALYSWYTGVYSGLVKLAIVLIILRIINIFFKPQPYP